MKKILLLAVLLSAVLCTACAADSINLEETSLTLSLAMDLDEKGNLVVYQTNPIFSPEAKKKKDTLSAYNVLSLTQGNIVFDAVSNGNVVNGKTQVVLIGKNLLKQRNLFPLLDTFYRDPENAVNARLVAVDGAVKELMNFDPEDKPRLAVYLANLIDSTHRREQTVKTELGRYFHQTYEKGMTPSITEIKKGPEEILVTGTALLDSSGKYAASLNRQESSLLLLLQQNVEKPVPFIFTLSANQREGEISVNINNVDYKIVTDYIGNKFYFDIQMDMDVFLMERNFMINTEENLKKLNQKIENLLKHECEGLIAKLKEHQVDPIGLGIYARGYHYQEWKMVEDNWGQAFSEAEIIVSPKVAIQSFGVIK
ncbi:MAG: Ger(x)C family spore germination protein [Desulfotomaculum sp.]|nr:Ger(x)C family spore germination protein [Desulfotomaculum sp.]